MLRVRVRLATAAAALAFLPVGAKAQEVPAATASLRAEQILVDNAVLGSATAAQMRNAAALDLGAVAASGTIGVNVAAGVFNIQKNAIAIVIAPDVSLAQAFTDVTQHAQHNTSALHDVVNDVTVTIAAGGAEGNIGVNVASGVGNLQINSATIATR